MDRAPGGPGAGHYCGLMRLIVVGSLAAQAALGLAPAIDLEPYAPLSGQSAGW